VTSQNVSQNLSKNLTIEQGISLRAWTWWKIGGPAEFFVLPKTLADLMRACEWANENKHPITILGGGTNVLVSDDGVKGLVICLREFRGLEQEVLGDRLVIRAWAGTPKSDLVKVFVKAKLPPALFLCGLPGDIGGGVVMNAGVAETISPREFNEIIDWVEVLREGQVIRLLNNQIGWHYRSSKGWQPGIIVRAQLSWAMNTDEEISRKVKEATKARLQKQPLHLPSCGSTFKNPPGQKAGALIEQAGLKGFQIGDAQVSLKHANFIVNLGDAKASEVRAVIAHVQGTVREKFHVELETEVRYLGCKSL
jgi:UDP-N-acetylmuramate dehydrogenase